MFISLFIFLCGIQVALADFKGVKPLNIVDGTFPSNPTYLTVGLYYDPFCSIVQEVQSFLLNTCMSDGSSSVMYLCENNVCTFYSYNDANCMTSPQSHQVTTCTLLSSDASMGYGYYQPINCGVTSPFNFGDGDFVAMINYADNSCTNVLTTSARVNGECWATGVEQSKSFQWPYENHYNESTICQGIHTSLNLETEFPTCYYPSDSNLDDPVKYESYVSFSYVSNNPDDDSQTLSEAEIVGIALGGFAFIVIVGGLVYYFFFYKNGKSAMSKQEMSNL
eukprot:gene9599-10423_t